MKLAFKKPDKEAVEETVAETPPTESEAERLDRLRKEDAAGLGRSEAGG